MTHRGVRALALLTLLAGGGALLLPAAPPGPPAASPGTRAAPVPVAALVATAHVPGTTHVPSTTYSPITALFPAAAHVATAALWSTPARAEGEASLSEEEAKQRLDEEQRNLELSKQKAGDLEQSVLQLAREREQLNSRLIETAKRVQDSEAELTKLEARIGELEEQEALLRGSLDQRQATIVKLLGALQRMGRNPPPVLITQRDDALKMVRSAIGLAAVYPNLRDQALELAGKLADLDRVIAGLTDQKAKLAEETATLEGEQDRLDLLSAAKQEEIAKVKDDLAGMREQVAAQSKNVADLNGLISKIIAKVEEEPLLKSTLGQYDRELEDGTAPGQIELADGGQDGAQDAAQDTTAAGSQPDTGTRMALKGPGRIKPERPFARSRGLLPMPASGRQILGYGQVTRFGTRSKGVALATRAGAQITSPCDGWVVYAGEFRAYGQLLIINAGGGYHVLLAGMSQIDVTMGQFVLAREPIGKMGQAQKGSGEASKSAPILYIEFRNKEQPVNPAPWWADEAEKVQG